jgi:hypothetical protein
MSEKLHRRICQMPSAESEVEGCNLGNNDPTKSIFDSQANPQLYFGLGVGVASCWFKAPALVFGGSLGVGEATTV